MAESITCTKCKRSLPALAEFAPAARTARSPWCRDCKKAAHRTWYLRNRDDLLEVSRAREIGREGNLKRSFGLSVEEYDEMLAAQGGRCAICRRYETRADHRTKRPHRLCVDHAHATGVVRGLLCYRCNVALGFFDDDLDRFAAAIAYLKRSSA